MSLSLLLEPVQSYEDSNGRPLNGGRLYTYEAGTLTPKATYQDAAGMIPNTNPVILNERGEAVLYGSGNYRLILENAAGATIWDRDNVDSLPSGTDLSGPDGASNIGYDDTTLDVYLKSRIGRVIDSIATLRGLDKTRFTRAFVLGYYAPGDGGGGPYYLDPADTTSTDNGGTIIVASDGGRWKLQATGTVTVKQFGARGDGTGNDTPFIQAAVTWALSLAQGGAIRIPAGNYILATTVMIPKTTKGFVLEGDGAASVLRGGNSFAGATVAVDGDSAAGGVNYILRDFAIEPPLSGTANGVRLRNANTIQLFRIYFGAVATAIDMESTFAARISGCMFIKCTQFGIYSSTACHNIVISGGNGFHDVGGTTGGAIKINEDTDNIVIFGNDFEYCRYVYAIKGATALTFVWNYVEYTKGVEFNHDTPAQGWICENNWIALNDLVNVSYNNISGGSFCGNTLHNIAIAWGANAFDIDVGANTLKTNGFVANTPLRVVTSFLNGYAQAGRTVSYNKSFDGRVTLRGTMNSGTVGQPALQLPVGYRPIQQEWFATVGGGNALCSVLIDINGNVVPQTAPGSLVSLDGISFNCKSAA